MNKRIHVNLTRDIEINLLRYMIQAQGHSAQSIPELKRLKSFLPDEISPDWNPDLQTLTFKVDNKGCQFYLFKFKILTEKEISKGNKS